MTDLPTIQYPMRYLTGDSDRVCVFALLKVSAGDTLDVGAYFSVVRRATLLGVTVNAAIAASVTGTVVTIPAGANNDAAILTAYGVAI